MLYNLIKNGAHWCDNIKSLVDQSTIIITCLPSPKAVSVVIEFSNLLISIKVNYLIFCRTQKNISLNVIH